MLKDYSEEAYAEIRRDLNELIRELKSESDKLKMKPIIVKGYQCSSEKEIYGFYEADMLTHDQYIAKLEKLDKKNADYLTRKRILEEKIEILEKLIYGCFSTETHQKKLRGETE